VADFDGTRKSDGKAKPGSQPADAVVGLGAHAADGDLAHRKTLPVGATQQPTQARLDPERAAHAVHNGSNDARDAQAARNAAQDSVRPLVSTRIDTTNPTATGTAADVAQQSGSERARQATRSPNESAFADTQRDVRQDGRNEGRNARAGRNPKLGRTLRMELKLGGLPVTPAAEPQASGRPPELGRSHSRLGGNASETPDPREGKSLQLGLTRRVGGSVPAEYSSARNVLTTTTPMAPQTATLEPRDPFAREVGNTDSRASRDKRESSLRNSVSRSESTRTTDRHLLSQTGLGGRRKAPRVGDRTMILSQKRSNLKDWLFVVALVAALGVTASMLFSYQNETAELSEQVEEEEAASALTATDGPPPAMNAPTAPTAPTAANNKAVAAQAPVRATELRSQPAGAEVAVQGAVVGNTPVRVARSDRDIDYTLRFPGYEPQVVRVGAQSPAAIAVTLRQTQSGSPNR